MDKNLLDRLTPSDRSAMREVARLLHEATREWNRIDGGIQSELNAEHNEECSLAHCLRWGTQAADELFEKMRIPREPLVPEAGGPPDGWDYATEENFVGYHSPRHNNRFRAAFEKRLGGVDSPLYELTILWEEEKFIPAHGGIAMPERLTTAEEAAAVVMDWYKAEVKKNSRPSKGKSTGMGM